MLGVLASASLVAVATLAPTDSGAACSARMVHAKRSTSAAHSSGAPAGAGHGTATPVIAILAYHDVADDARGATDAVSPAFLRRQIETCRSEGWTFLSLSDLMSKRSRPNQLPPKVLVLTFDGGFQSFRERALPVLRQAHVPAAVAVTTAWLEHAPRDTPRLMSWAQLRELAHAGVEVISRTHDLDGFEPNDPDGDFGPAAVTRRFVSRDRHYETPNAYRARIAADLAAAQRVFKKQLGRHATALAWPCGRDNDLLRQVAQQAGFHATLVTEGRAVTPADLRAGRLPRIAVTKALRFDADDAWLRPAPAPMRAAEIDLDDVYDSDPTVFRGRLDQLARRLKSFGATDAFVTVCRDPDSNGRFEGSYVMTDQAPVSADVWTHVAAKLAGQGIAVWARVPSMNLTWAWSKHSDWAVRRDTPRVPNAADSTRGATIANVGGAAGASDSVDDLGPLDALPGVAVSAWPTRLSPELSSTRRAATDFITDIASFAPIDGIVFDDDAFMSAGERLATDGHADAATKARAIDDLLAACRAAARAWRPECRFARRLDAATVAIDGVHPALAQDYEASLRDNDLTIVMTYPWMTGKDATGDAWIEAVGRRAEERCASVISGVGGGGASGSANTSRGGSVSSKPSGAGASASMNPRAAASPSVLLEIQTYDWLHDTWLPGRSVAAMASAARKSGVTNVALCPVSAQDGEIPARLLSDPPPTMASDEASGK